MVRVGAGGGREVCGMEGEGTEIADTAVAVGRGN